MIAIIDYDIGNIAAVTNMLRRIGVRCQVTSRVDDVEQAERIILPGNGSFDACMKNLRASGLIPVLEHRVLDQKVPLLGICVGAQMLGYESAEGMEPGLGWLDMRVRRFPDQPGLRVPHMGWNQVVPMSEGNYLTQDMDAETRFYFVHSYYMEPADPSAILLRSTYGIEFASGVSSGNIAGVQFHPEKSHRFGKQLLAAFAKGN
ncbi:imidazole glycerol phosphate synthase subunit HisH [Corticimicrobacter populi]|uniref:Imidazole glycerol phosphate synthase subunit HisH n=1 Tax=Corticimicrobacter populi TaxID=2175229 RepID=A0A2V1JVE2_9BURK|nr:imidazole glycerol phosphate synthase subunit HisH [Corticimicrobacter populi]PWF22170.1 imidazole glycerol phosphate synthase subunit HisH [Corticimicrobacter populi]